MSLLLLLNPKQFGSGSNIDPGPDIWINILDGWKRKRKEQERESEPEVEKAAKIAVQIPKDNPRTDELEQQIVQFRTLSDQLSALNEAVAKLEKLENVRASEIEQKQRELEQQILAEMALDIKRRDIARKILEMMEEEELFMLVVTGQLS